MRQIQSVLIVDDDDDDREMFCEAVGKVSTTTKCFHALNGLEALEMLRSGDGELPDMIFLDLNMPRLNGKQCLVQLKQLDHVNNIPVIIYSTSNLKEDRDETLKLGASGFISKPTSFEQLCLEIQTAFSIK